MTTAEIAETVNLALTKAGYHPIGITFATTDTGREIVINWEDGPAIQLFSSIIKKTSFEAVKACLVELGRSILDHLDERQKLVWERRLVSVRPDQVSQFQGRVESGSFINFEAVVRDTPRAVDRLIAIHLANGLLANGQTMKTAPNIKVDQWGLTSQLSKGQVPFSLIPLLSAYAPAGIYRDFGEAFTDDVLNGLRSIGESSVMEAYHRLIYGLVKDHLVPLS